MLVYMVFTGKGSNRLWPTWCSLVFILFKLANPIHLVVCPNCSLIINITNYSFTILEVGMLSGLLYLNGVTL